MRVSIKLPLIRISANDNPLQTILLKLGFMSNSVRNKKSSFNPIRNMFLFLFCLKH